MKNKTTASYLLRFDDICPTMKWSNWDLIESILMESDIRPILAVVPDNRDSDLRVEPANKSFWNRVRSWQAAGWTIGFHGFQHTYVTTDPGLFSNRRASEFAGLPANIQRQKLLAAVSILRDQGVHSNLWIAPGHSFDRTTIEILLEVGVTAISDGFWVAPFRDKNGIFWIPQQQLSEEHIVSIRSDRPVSPKSRGVWTLCLHPNAWTREFIARFKREIRQFRSVIGTVEEVQGLYANRPLDWMDRLNVTKCELRRRLWLMGEDPVPLAPACGAPSLAGESVKSRAASTGCDEVLQQKLP